MKLARIAMPSKRIVVPCAAALLLALTGSCSEDPVAPEEPGRIAFSRTRLELGSERETTVEVINVGGRAVGPVLLQPGVVRDAGGVAVPGAELRASPEEIGTLNPGTSALVELRVTLPPGAQPGPYDASLEASAGPEVTASLDVRLSIPAVTDPEAGSTLSIVQGDTVLRRGDVSTFLARVVDSTGAPSEATVTWAVDPASAGFVSGNGRFVPYEPGEARIIARAGALADSLGVRIEERSRTGSFSVVGRGMISDRHTSDLWVHGDHAYTGTWGIRSAPGASFAGNTLNVWDVSDPGAPVRTASVTVDARTVNDVKVSADGELAVITHEGSTDGQNGVTLLDLSDPSDPRVVERFTRGLESGVHNVWIDGDHVYLVVDGVGNGMRVLDVSDPSEPEVVGSYYAGSSFLHDVYVRDGLAFLSHWDAGLVILDVGNGIEGGSPSDPVEVGRVMTSFGNTHNAWYWPEADYVFVGEEDFSRPGVMHVIDVRNLREPREVATFRVPGATPHNFWLDEEGAVLYLAWYGNGVRALDVEGELLGELDRQGREIAGFTYDGSAPGGSCQGAGTCTWAPQLHGGLVWVSDMNTGLLALQPSF